MTEHRDSRGEKKNAQTNSSDTQQTHWMEDFSQWRMGENSTGEIAKDSRT